MFGLRKYEKDFWPRFSTPNLFALLARDPIVYSSITMGTTNQDDSQYWYEFDMPGVEQTDINVSLENGIISVSAKTETRNYEFSRRLPRHADVEKSSAEYKNGVLKIILPKAEAAKKIEISVKSAN